MSEIEQKALELIEKFEALATEVAPDALDLGLAAARVAAAEGAFSFVLPAAICAAMWQVARKTYKADNFTWGDESPSAKGLTVLGCAIVGILTGTIALIEVSIWPFVGIFYPELWIAKQVLGW